MKALTCLALRYELYAFCIGAFLDLVFGDPHWLWHPVRGIGKLIELYEAFFRRCFPKTRRGEQAAGLGLTVSVLLTVALAAAVPVFCAYWIHPLLGLAVESVYCYRILAARSLHVESRRVQRALEHEGLEAGRKAVSMIVGRDTECLSKEGVIRAAVETIAENTSDGVIAPMLFLAFFGPVGGWIYKAVNTMDSMVGYKNENYLWFGWASARLDDALNFFPARISAWLMLFASLVLGMDTKRAYRIYIRDRRKHASPNSAQTEAVMAGALGVQLAGDAVYFGKLVEKPFIGDPVREVEPADIALANRLMYGTAVAGFVACVGIRLLYIQIFAG